MAEQKFAGKTRLADPLRGRRETATSRTPRDVGFTAAPCRAEQPQRQLIPTLNLATAP